MEHRTAAGPGYLIGGANAVIQPSIRLEHDLGKWKPVFGKDHAQSKSSSGMTIRRKVIPL
jgi:hypothetical protein